MKIQDEWVAAWNKGETKDALRIRQALDRLGEPPWSSKPSVAVNLVWYSRRRKGWYAMFAMSVTRRARGLTGCRIRVGANVPHCLARIRLLGTEIFDAGQELPNEPDTL